MSTMDAVLIGALGMAALLLVIVAGVMAVWKVWPMLAELTKGFTDMVKAVRGVPESLKGIKDELEYMRGLAQQQQVPAGSGADEGYIPTTGGPPDKPTGPIPFPSPVYDRYAVAKEELPDAELEQEDIDLINQTDEELVAMEKLEQVRQRSGFVEDSDAKHDAIIAESD